MAEERPREPQTRPRFEYGGYTVTWDQFNHWADYRTDIPDEETARALVAEKIADPIVRYIDLFESPEDGPARRIERWNYTRIREIRMEKTDG